ncbi:MAG TPA: extracellular solute-binding protein [Trueperaceae bacterium]|nr:extracellular solute-binding protein [Trueperaceae bacterium]HRP45919.1 extracellular solute-binding protein [Trueperaceae bacterium]
MKRVIFAIVTLASLSFVLAQTQIEFWYAFSDANRSGWIQDRMTEFNAQLAEDGRPYVMVGERKGSYPETQQAAVLAARQGNPPHLVQLYEVGSQIAVDSGIFIPVGELGEFDTSDYIAPVLNYYTIDGQVNSIPFNSSSPITYANKTLMDAAGVTTVPLTYSEMLAACDAAAAAGVLTSDVKCFGVSLNGWFVEQWVAEQGATLVNNDNGRAGRATEVLLTSEAVTNVFNWWKAMNDKGYYTYTGKLEDWDGSDAIFTNGKVMFHITSTADLVNITNAVGDKFELVTGMLPIQDGVTRNGVVIGGASVWIVRDHPMEELLVARDFVLYMTNAENMVSWHKATGYYPVRISSVQLLRDEGWFTEFPNASTAFDQLLDTIPNSATAGALMGTFQATRTIVEQAVQKVLAGATVESALEEAKRLADAALAEYNANF